MKRRGRHYRRRRGGRVLFALAAVVALIILTDIRLRPVIERVAAHQVRVFASRTVNAAILEEVESSGPNYGDIVLMERDGAGITAISANMREINRFKAEISEAVARKMEELGVSSIYIPLGTLFGNAFTSGRGPLVELKAYPTGYVQTDLSSQFVSAGINQTLHQIILGVSVQIVAIIPGYSIQTEITTTYCVAETVIVGGIPDTYAQIGVDTAPLFSKIAAGE